MAKAKQKAAQAPASNATAPSVAPKGNAQVIMVLKGDAKFRGARELWYQAVKQNEGKTVDEFIKATKDTPPSVPKSGKAENPGGWLSWFKRQGIVEVKAA